MLPTDAFVELSRWQFALTSMYHFIFVPLTLGLSWILFIMESVYVMTGKEIYKDMTRFWGKLFGINFALGVTTGITMEFQFGTNWAYYSHYVGDIFGAPLAIEGVEDPVQYYIEHDLPHKLKRDREYVARASVWLDLKILAQTLYCILFKSWSFLKRKT